MSALPEAVRSAMDRDACVSAGVEHHYDAMVAGGSDSGFAAMLALRQPPGVRGSDRSFMNSSDVRNHGLGSYTLDQQAQMVGAARRAGINITGKVYKSGLGQPSDPSAWVGGLGDVLATARKKNLSVQGAVNCKGAEMPPPPEKPLNERIVRDFARHYVKEDPNWKKKPGELRDFIIDRHGNRKARKAEKKKGNGILSVA